jgi:hypothetical protein
MMERDESEPGAETYEEDALGVPDLSTSTPEHQADPPDQPMPPGERPRGADTWGTTAAEQHGGRPLDDRLAEETSDVAGRTLDESLRLVDDGEPDDTPELVSSGDPNDDEDPTAEEAAVHVRRDAPGGATGPDTYPEGTDEGSPA